MATETAPPEQPVVNTGATETPALPRSDAPPETSPDQLAEQAKEKLAKMDGFWNRVNPPKEGEVKPKPVEEDKEPEPEPAAEKPKKPKAAPTEDKEPEPKPKRKAKPEIDPIELAEATGRSIARELAREKAPPAPKEPEVEPDLPEEFAPDVAVFEEMARMNPKQYAGIKRELAKYAKAEDEYTAKWEADHPGEEFDPESDEHNDFYKRIRPKYEQRDFEAAKESLIEQRAVAKAEERLRQRQEEMEQRREKASTIQPEVDREMIGLMGEMLTEADPENAELAKDWASIQTLDEKNPPLADVMITVHNEIKPVIEATKRLFRGIDQYDQNKPAHQRIAAMVNDAENQVSRLPLKDRYDDQGRLFATQDEYVKMSPTEKARHWYVGEQELMAIVHGQAKQQTKVLYEALKKQIERYSRVNGTPPKQQPKAQQDEPKPREDTSSPSVSGRATLPGDGTPANNKPASGKDWFFNKYLGA